MNYSGMSSCIKLTSMFSVISEDDQSSFSPSVLSPIVSSIDEEFPTLGSSMKKVKKIIRLVVALST